jgi:hypothetical protein
MSCTWNKQSASVKRNRILLAATAMHACRTLRQGGRGAMSMCRAASGHLGPTGTRNVDVARARISMQAGIRRTLP